MKRCSECDSEKPLEDFHRFKRSSDGRMSICATCDNARVRRYRENNLEARRRYDAERRASDPVGHRERNRQWRETNKEHHRTQARQWAIDNPGAYRERLKRWREANPEKVAGYREARREANALYERKRRAALGSPTVTTSTYVDILSHDPCAYCTSPGITLDHIEAVATGGGPEWTNLTAACHSCNSSKKAEPLLLWLVARPA